MDARKLAGREAEARCAEYLRERGYKILAMNYACRCGEIDIVAAKGAYLAFVEVKERANRRFGEAREAVTRTKQARLRLAAGMWLSTHDTDLQPRFDVAEIYPGEGKPEIHYIENAFE